MFASVLVANRGEIARRVFATCRAMGLTTVAVYSDADASSPHVAEADLAVRLPGVTASQTYLRGDLLIEAARRAGADAIHPGYGFLSESAEFAAAVVDAGLVWIGPPAKAIAAMGSKLSAKQLVAAAGVPVLASWSDPAEVTSFPVLVKASAGGGGKGMRVVSDPADLPAALSVAAREAQSAFGDATVFCESYVHSGRHIEVQVFADTYGTTVALGERECSIQRRHQKIIEECPSPAVDPALRAALGQATVAAARAVSYVGAGTVEFLLAPDGGFFFLEMNTRLQVEHPVTECVFGLDLVRLQLLVAAGEPLPWREPPPMRGHAIEARLYAEDPRHDWRPAAGTLHRFAVAADATFAVPPGNGVRLDSGVAGDTEVPAHYDPMLAKVIAWAPEREEAARRLATTLRAAELHGVATNRDLLVRVLRDAEFGAGGTDTAFLERHPEVFQSLLSTVEQIAPACLAAALATTARRREAGDVWHAVPAGWRNVASAPQRAGYSLDGAEVVLTYSVDRDGRLTSWSFSDSTPVEVALVDATPTLVVLRVAGVDHRYRVHTVDDQSWVDGPDGSLHLAEAARFPLPTAALPSGSLLAAMPGTVTAVAVTLGQLVAAGEVVLTLEAMKLEQPVHAPEAGTVTQLLVAAGDRVDAAALLAVVTPNEAVVTPDEAVVTPIEQAGQ